MIIQNNYLLAEFHPKGAALHRLIYRPLNRSLVKYCTDRTIANHYINNIVGPIANRVSQGRFTIDGKQIHLDQNEGQNTLHGGRIGLSELTWEIYAATDLSVHFHCTTQAGQMGFPHPARFDAIYTIEGASLNVTLQARSAHECAFNLAPHLYFNLNGSGDIRHHELTIYSEYFLPVDNDNIPTGAIDPVGGTELDFRLGKIIGDIALDHNLCFNPKNTQKQLKLQVPDLSLTVHSNQRGVQIYDGRHFGRTHLAIEPQGWPDAVNNPTFPSQFIDKHDTYTAESSFFFSD